MVERSDTTGILRNIDRAPAGVPAEDNFETTELRWLLCKSIGWNFSLMSLKLTPLAPRRGTIVSCSYRRYHFAQPPDNGWQAFGLLFLIW